MHNFLHVEAILIERAAAARAATRRSAQVHATPVAVGRPGRGGPESLDPSTLHSLQVGPGCRRTDLPAPTGLRAWIAEIEPGARWPHIDRNGPEGQMILVLDGDLIESGRCFHAGDYVLYAPNSEHRPASRNGARLFGLTGTHV